ncbi:MAG: hypothetical protein IKM72_11645, partial [Oscillospiraceae bacterium]|nr:hypothetical protein [Oscillospiraceae bacterium]
EVITLTEKDILKDIRESFEASGDHLSDDFLKKADLKRNETDSVTLSGRKKRFPVLAALASAAAVFSLLVAFHFYDLGRKYDHELMLPEISSENNDQHDFTGNDGYTNTLTEPHTAAYSSAEYETTEMSAGISSGGMITNEANTGSVSSSDNRPAVTSRKQITESTRNQNVTVSVPHTDPYTVTLTEAKHTDTETQAYTVPVTVNASTEPWWNIGTYPCTTEATTKAEPVTEPWWNIGTYPVTTEATTRSRPVTEPIGTYPCTENAEPVTIALTGNAGTYPYSTDETEEPFTELPAETTSGERHFWVSSKSEWDENEDPLILEDDRFYYTVEYPGKYIVEFSDGYSCTVEYAVINGLATPKELFRAGLPYYKVTWKD